MSESNVTTLPSVIILTVDDPECKILLEYVTKMAEHDSKGQPLPEGVKAPTPYTVGIAALREGLKAMAQRVTVRRRVGVRLDIPPGQCPGPNNWPWCEVDL